MARKLDQEIIMNIPNCDNFDLIISHAKSRAPATYLEIGTNEGHSLYHIINSRYIKSATSVDTWGSECGGTGRGSPDHVKSILGDKADLVTFLTGSSHDILPTLTEKYSIVFVDGDHSIEGCWKDMEDSLPLLSEGGIMLVDDIRNPAHLYLEKVVTDFATQFDLNMEISLAHCGVGILTRK